MTLKKIARRIIFDILYEAQKLDLLAVADEIPRTSTAKRRLSVIFKKLAALPNVKVSENGDRVYIPFKGTFGSKKIKINNDELEITKFLKDNDYVVLDYKKGVAMDPYGRKIKIGKALTKLKNQELLNKFNTDKAREGSRSTINSYMVFSHDKFDIAEMSTDRGWTSCLDLSAPTDSDTVSADTFISRAIKHGTFVVYLIRPDDLDIFDPIARIKVVPFFNIKDRSKFLYFPDSVYGTAPPTFEKSVTRILESIQNITPGKYKVKQGVHCDRNSIETILPKDLNVKDLPKTKDELIYRLKFFDVDLSKVTVHSDLSITYGDKILITNSVPLGQVEQLPFKFRAVSGDFLAYSGKIKTLKNFPDVVGGDFTLDGGIVVKTLEGGPRKVGNEYNCSWNSNLISLRGSPIKVPGSFFCYGCKQLTSLEGGPKEVGGSYGCSWSSHLITLKGAPKKIFGNFECSGGKLKNLEGGPIEVHGDFKCHDNQLITLSGAPKYVKGDFNISNNPGKFTEEDVRAVTKVDGKVIV